MQGEQYGTIYNLSDMLASGKRIITLGREVGNLIALKDDMSYYMSRYHCCIEAHSSSGWILRDGQWNVQKKQWMESSNGTYVNSKQVSQLGHILETGDIISIGDIKIRFEIN
jgi:pSer/pThr/pTyr-binding forkhead associated (FHA) protein